MSDVNSCLFSACITDRAVQLNDSIVEVCLIFIVELAFKQCLVPCTHHGKNLMLTHYSHFSSVLKMLHKIVPECM